ncbi:Ganglioside induced differentiation associated protein, partial [Operophtera brumata]
MIYFRQTLVKMHNHKEVAHASYERLLRRARTEDLSEVSGIGCLYQSGVDRLGRPVVVFIGKWFPISDIDLEKALLYLIKLLDPIVRGDYVIAYFHTLASSGNHPPFSWLKEVEYAACRTNTILYPHTYIDRILPHARLLGQPPPLLVAQGGVHGAALQIAYFHTLATSGNHPPFSWLKEVYTVLPYKYKKNLKAFYIVHPTFWTKAKVHTLPGVEFLYSVMARDQLDVPAFVTEYDMTVRHYTYIKATVHTLPGVEFLYSVMARDQLDVPAFVTEYDMTVRHYTYIKATVHTLPGVEFLYSVMARDQLHVPAFYDTTLISRPSKVHTLPGVEFLYSVMARDQLHVPAFVTEYDMTVRHYTYITG